MKLYQLPNGDWVNPEHVCSIFITILNEVIVTLSNGRPIILSKCSCSAVADLLRDKLAWELMEASADFDSGHLAPTVRSAD